MDDVAEDVVDGGASVVPNDRPPAFRASDRWAGRVWRLVAAHPYVAGSLALHALLLATLLNVPGAGERERVRAQATEAGRVEQQLARTQARALGRQVDRMAEIERALSAEAGAPPASAAGVPTAASIDGASPMALVARAQAIADAIDAGQRRRRAARLAALTGLPFAEAARQLDAETAASAASTPGPAPVLASPTTSPPEQIIARLARRARDALDERRAQVATARRGTEVTLPTRDEIASANATTARASTRAASRSTGQARAADGNLRSTVDQLASMARLGAARGRVGVAGARSGLSVNREGVPGVAGGRIAREDDTGPASLAGRPAVTARGASIDLTAPAVRGSHDLVRYVEPAPIDAATLHTGAGRTFGRGGAFATRVYLDSWYVIGPFAGAGERSLDAAYPPEDDVDLDGAYRGQGGRVLTWRYASRGFYPFLPPDRAENAVYYAYTELRVDDDRDVWLAIGADDDSKLWLDGRLVWISEPGDKPWYHPPYYLRDEQVASLALVEGNRRVHLARGVHRLLFKLFNDRDRTFFSVVVTP